MTPEELTQHLAALLRPIVTLVHADPAAREALRQLARWLASEADAPSRDAAESLERTAATNSSGVVEIPAREVEPHSPALPDHDTELHIGDVRMLLRVPGTPEEAHAARQAAARNADAPRAPVVNGSNGHTLATFEDLPLIAQRCRVKAQGCAWAVRHRERYDPDDLEARIEYRDIIARAKSLPNCYVWATNPNLALPAMEVIRDFETGYANLALAAELIQEIQQRSDAHDWRGDAYALLAEAQSALRAGLARENLYVDADQEAAFHWLRTHTFQERVLVPRHMKLDDPASIENGPDLRQRLDALLARMAERSQHQSLRRTLMNKARYHARRLTANKSDDPAADWRTIIDTVAAIIADGAAPSDIELRELILPLVDGMPEDLALPPAFDQVMASVDAYLATREAEGDSSEPRTREYAPQVAAVAELLEGTTMVLIGGDCRRESQAALERAFRLKELNWIAAAHHQSHYLFEPAIARAETSIVLLAIRWSSHSFGNAKALCERYGKPFANLPGGYNPNQVATQILAQAGETLRQRDAVQSG